jgi:transcription antitermination factor NusA-like protein
LKNLSEKLGVEDIKVMEDVQLVPEEQTHDGEEVIVYVERFERSVIITYNQMNVDAEELADVMVNIDFEVGQIEKTGRTGKSIIIPPNVVG